jgi:hypothetical protein
MTEFDILKKTYTDQIKSYQDAIISGRCVDWSEYRETCGKIRGLSFALDELTALADRLRRDEDE